MIGSTIVAVAASAVVAVLANEIVRVYSRSVRKDRARLHAAAEALNDHVAAVEKLVSSEAVPPSLKKFALAMAVGSLDHVCAQRLVHILRGSLVSSDANNERAAEVVRALDVLRARHPDEYDTFNNALKSGIVALALQWPDTARAIEELAVRMAKDSTENTVRRFSSLHGSSGFRPGGHVMA